MRTKSPGSSSRTSVAPVMSRAHVSEATTQPRPSRPSTSGRKPRGSTIAYSVRPTVINSEYAPSTRSKASSNWSSGSRSEARDQMYQHFAVGRALEQGAFGDEIGAQLDGGGEVAVVRQ